MVVQFSSGDIFGIDGRVVEIQIDLLAGLQNFVISGCGGPRIKESRERVRSALVNSGYRYPGNMRVVVNLAPADLTKDGSGFDLPIALGILAADGQLKIASSERWGIIGELALDGNVCAVQGTLGMVAAFRRAGVMRAVVPLANLAEARAIEGVRALGVRHLSEAIAVLKGEEPAGIVTPIDSLPVSSDCEPDYGDVLGHASIKRALALAVAGEHNVLMVGPPGSGKSFLARRIGGLLPPLNQDEVLEITQIYSAAGALNGRGLLRTRPYRAPHHTISWAGLVGGGVAPRPGEITLAHRGVLFLDELPEFPRRSLEALREPLEEGRILISRAHSSLQFPARFLLVAAMNPCPCGNHRNPRRRCHCTQEKVRAYLQRISGPLLDRIDLRLEANSPPNEWMLASGAKDEVTSAELRALVERAVAFRRTEGRELPNRALEWGARDQWAPLAKNARALLGRHANEMDLSTRSLTRALRLARTIADAAKSSRIEEHHLLESLSYHAPRGGQDYLCLLQAL